MTSFGRRKTAYNSTYKKLAVQWLNEAFCFVSSFVVADSLVLRNRQLLVAAKRYRQCAETNYADSNVKDDKDSTPQITLTVDSTSINVSPTQQRFRLRGQLKKEKRNFDLFTRKVLSPWRSFRSADSSAGQLIKGFLKSWDIEKSLI